MLIHLILATLASYAAAQGGLSGLSSDNCTITLTDKNGEITSPGYPDYHLNSLDCEYVIEGDGHSQMITLDLLELYTFNCHGCGCGWLIIDGGPKLCSPATQFHKTYVFQDTFVINLGSPYGTKIRFRMQYSVAMGAHDNCTSTHTKTSGQISTPFSFCNCTNTIIGSGKLQTLSLDFISLNFTTSPNCDAGWFTIDGGPRICSSTPFKETYAFFGSLDIVIHGGDLSVNSCGSFVVNYSVQDNCTTTLTAAEGEITSPGYPGIHIDYLSCTYVIMGDGHARILTIDLLELDLTAAYYNCPYDWLIIDDGLKLCYPTTFQKRYVIQDRLTIKFRTDYDISTRGFKMRYSLGMDANDTSIHTKTSGQISPSCSSCNSTYNDCTNTIIGSGKLQILTLDFISLNFTTSPNCDAGWFTIDGGPRMCYSGPFKRTYAFFGSLDIVIHGGDRSENSCGGFVVNYNIQDNCTTTLTAAEGEITSPGYPSITTDYLSCTYVIMGDGHARILIIDLLKLDLHGSSDCRYDWLIIDDGLKLCYPTTFQKRYVIQDRLTIKFRTTYTTSTRGLKMHYSIGMDANDTSIHTKTSGQISTPCSSCNCTYNDCTNTIIGSGKLQILTLDFVSVNFTTSPNCDAEWITIGDGPRICKSTPFKTTHAFFGSVDIVTHGGENSYDDLVVNYAVKDNCTTTLTAGEGEITSPGYPGIRTYLSCTYVIVGDGHTQTITTHLLEMDFYTSSNCYYDWLTIGDGPKICYPTAFYKTYVFKDRFIIKFGTHYISSSRGFKMHYSVDLDSKDTCTSFHTRTSGQITTSCTSCNCGYNNCTNTIIGSGKLQAVTLDFVSLNFTATPKCDAGWFTINGGPKICTSTDFKTTYAFFGSVDIVIHGGDQSRDTCGGFVVNYAVQDVVNNILTYNTNSGQIIGPSFPGTSSYNLDETTYIIVGHFPPQNITLDITFTTYSSGSCSYNKLTLNSVEELCDSGTFSRTYLSQSDFTIKFAGHYHSVFLIHYEKEDIIEGKTYV